MEESIVSGYDIIISAKDGSLEVNSYDDASGIVYSMFNRAKLIK